MLLIATFFWAYNERKRFRKGDRFGKVVVEFAAETLDKLYSDFQDKVDELRTLKDSDGAATAFDEKSRAELIRFFNGKLYGCRQAVIGRVSCIQDEPLKQTINFKFEMIEDEFAEAMASLDLADPRLTQVSLPIIQGSTEIINRLIAQEGAFSKVELKVKSPSWIRRIMTR